jgi:phosphosulfolactate synthase
VGEMNGKSENGWDIELQEPVQGRLAKPRDKGLNMVIDKGLGVNALQDLLQIAGDYIDYLKLGFGTSFVYPEEILKEKIRIACNFNIDVYPGGTLFEVAVNQNRLNEFLFRAKQLGFTAIEVSNGTIDLSDNMREKAIKKSMALGFKVLTEVGKKDRKNSLSLGEMIEQIEKDKLNGAYKIIIEGRESGKGVSIYDSTGDIDMEMLEELLMAVQEKENILIWEAPMKKQQSILINKLGPNVNLGNINTGEIIALEALRRGLRGDTFAFTLKNVRKEENIIRENIMGA